MTGDREVQVAAAGPGLPVCKPAPDPAKSREHALLDDHNQILEMVLSDAPLATVLEHIARIIERHGAGDSVAAILLLDAADNSLHTAAAPSLPEDYCRAINGITARSGLGTCADAVANRDVRVTTDLAAASGWTGISHLPLGLGLVAAWSRPILARDGRALGSIGTYFRTKREPTTQERMLVERLARTAAIAIERLSIDHAVARERSRMDLVVRSADVGVWFCELPFGELVWDGKVKEHFHLPRDARVTYELFFERLHPEDRERTREAIEASIERHATYDIDYRTVSPDGSKTNWIRAVGRCYYSAEGKPVSFDGVTINITRRKEMEQSLRESEATFRTLADSIAQFAWMTDETGWIHWYNKRWFEYTGTTLEEMQGWGWMKVHHPDHVERVVDNYARSIRAGTPWEDIFPLRSRDGEYRWFLSRAYPIRDESGRILRWFGTNTDITEQRDTQEKLRRHIDMLATLNSINLALASPTDTERIVQTAVDAGVQLTGASFGAFFYNTVNERGESYTLYTLSGVPREAFEKFPMPRKTAIFGPTFDGVGPVRSDDITKDERYGRNAPHRGMPEGHLPVRSYLAVPVLSREGHVIGGMFFGHPEPAVFSDEAERYALGIAAQAATTLDNARLYTDLHRSEQRYKLAAAATNDAIWDWDLRTGAVDWNNAVAERFGHATAVEGTTARWWIDHIHPDDRDRINADIHSVIDDPEESHWSAEYRFARSDGTYADVLDRGTVQRDTDGKPLRMVGAMLDISERRAAERERQELLESERSARASAERAGRLKDEFLATLSHELRTPLNAILGWTHLLRKWSGDPEKALRAVDVIERNTRAQNQLISDLLDISRISSGKLRIEMEPVRLDAVIRSAVESIAPAAEAKGISVRCTLDGIEAQLRGDPGRLQQVVWNLLSNAVKFTDRDGCVKVHLAAVNSHWEVSVEDTGQGIDPEFLPHLFERFRQADASSARQHGGLGLGLALVRQIVELHGGRARASSPGIGRGSTFTIELPQRRPTPGPRDSESARAEAEPGHEDALAGVRILVVDDEPDALEMMRRVLEEYGAKVSPAGSADEALQCLEAGEFDAILSDIGMPRRDGYELIAEARRSGCRTPAAAVTAFARPEDRARALRAGYQAHITKPVEPSQLLRTVLQLTQPASA